MRILPEAYSQRQVIFVVDYNYRHTHQITCAVLFLLTATRHCNYPLLHGTILIHDRTARLLFTATQHYYSGLRETIIIRDCATHLLLTAVQLDYYEQPCSSITMSSRAARLFSIRSRSKICCLSIVKTRFFRYRYF